MLKYFFPIFVLATMAMGDPFEDKDSLRADPVQCTLCKTVFTEIVALSKTNATQETILHQLEQKLCNSTGSMNQGCQTLIETFGPLMLKYLSGVIDPAKVCQLFGLCPTKLSSEEPKKVIEVKADPASYTLCEFLAQYADNLLKQNKIEQQIIKALRGVCNIAPEGLKTECIALVDQFGPNIVDLLIKYGNDTKKVCQTIKICPASTSSTQSKVVEMARADLPLCALCQFIVKYADNLFIQNKTEQQIVTALEGVCNIIPQPLADECITLVAQFAPNIVDLLIKYGNDTKKVCQTLKICPDAQFVNKVESQVRADPPLCILCQYLVQYADTLLENNATEAQIIKGLEAVCNLAPGSLKSECADFIERFGPDIIELLLKFSNDPKKVCQAIKVCTSSAY